MLWWSLRNSYWECSWNRLREGWKIDNRDLGKGVALTMVSILSSSTVFKTTSKVITVGPVAQVGLGRHLEDLKSGVHSSLWSRTLPGSQELVLEEHLLWEGGAQDVPCQVCPEGHDITDQIGLLIPQEHIIMVQTVCPSFLQRKTGGGICQLELLSIVNLRRPIFTPGKK